MDRPRTLHDAADLPRTALQVTFIERDALDDHCVLAREGTHNDTGLALVLTRDDLYFISFFDVHTKIIRRPRVPRTRWSASLARRARAARDRRYGSPSGPSPYPASR